MPMTKHRRTRVRVFAVRLFFRTVVQLFVLVAFSASGTVLCAQTVGIRLVDGRNGRPMASTCVNVWAGKERKEAMAIPTDKDGVAWLRFTDKEGEIDLHNRWKDCGDFGVINPVVKYDGSLRVNAGYVLCQLRKPDDSWLSMTDFSTKKVLEEGIVTANTCGKATASPKPGELVIFVRPLTWWEKLKQ
jgi:hypothetical protein